MDGSGTGKAVARIRLLEVTYCVELPPTVESFRDVMGVLLTDTKPMKLVEELTLVE